MQRYPPWTQSAPEPDLHQRRLQQTYAQNSFSHSVPGHYSNSAYYHIDGFTPHPQGDTYNQQPNHFNISSAAGQYRRHNAHLVGMFAPIYAQTQPFDLNVIYSQPSEQHPIPSGAPLASQELDMEFMFDQDSDLRGPGSIISPQTLPFVPEETYSMSSHLSPPTPISVPAQPMQPLVAPDHSFSETPLPTTASMIHERYNSHRLNNTSGDFRTTGSMLFSEDEPVPKRDPPTRVNHYVTLQPLPRLETDLPVIHRGNPLPAGNRLVEPRSCSESPETPVLEGGIDGFCNLSFPDNEQLREELRRIMHSGKNGDAQDLHQFLDCCESKKWKCRFNTDAGGCGELFKRRDSAVGHIRQVHIKMLPIPCRGDCGDPKCTRWFPSAAAKGSHTRKGSVKCDKCHLLTSGRNLVRHQRTNKCIAVANAVANVIAELVE